MSPSQRLAQSRLSFLADVSAKLASTLDYNLTLAEVARLAVPVLGDWCLVDLREAERSPAAGDRGA